MFPPEESKKVKASDPPVVWNEDDEILLLKGMVEYEVTQQCNPYDDMGKFFKFVKPSLHLDVQPKQLTNKLWVLKNRFLCSEYNSTIPRHAKLLEISKSIRSWGQHANTSLDVFSDEEDNVVVDDVGLDKLVDKLSKVVQTNKRGKLASTDSQNGKKGEVINTDGQSNKNGKMVVEHVDADKTEGNVEADSMVDDVDKLSKADKTGKVNNVAIDDVVRVDKAWEVKKKKKLVARDVENVKESYLVSNDVNRGRYLKKKKGKFVISDGQDNQKDDVVVGDVDAENLLTRDVQNVDAENDVQKPKKNFDFTFMFPGITSMLELETLSWMPQHLNKKYVMDTIKSMGWEKANRLEKEWADIHLKEMELKAKKFDMTSKLLEAMRREFKP